MRYLPAIVLSAIWAASLCPAEEKPDHQYEKAKINYSVGYQIGGDFKRQGVEISPRALVKGIRDALSGEKALMTQEEMNKILTDLKRRIAAAQKEGQKKTAEENLVKGEAFLEENAKREWVKTLPSKLQYKTIQEGTGSTPKATDTVTVHYRGTLIDGTEFDSSYSRGKPATFQVNRVIRGWTEAPQMMKEGAKWQLFIPPELAYGERSAGSRIGPNSTLIFEVELISIGKDAKDGRSK